MTLVFQLEFGAQNLRLSSPSRSGGEGDREAVEGKLVVPSALRAAPPPLAKRAVPLPALKRREESHRANSWRILEIQTETLTK